MTDEVLAWLKGLIPSYRSHLRKVKPLSYEAWLEVKRHRWAVFVNPDNPKQDGRPQLLHRHYRRISMSRP